MRAFLITALSSSALALSGCSYENLDASSASSEAVEMAKPNFAAAVAAPGRAEADMKLDEARKPAQVLEFMGLETGDTVLDIFAGGGYFSEIMAAAVGPDGTVVAMNPPQFVSSDQALEKWLGVTTRQPNISQQNVPFSEFTANPASYDFAMLHLIYHDLYWESEKFKMPRTDPAVFLTKLYSAMKPGGIVAVIDHVGGEGETRAVVDKTHRINPDVVKTDFTAAGFVLEAQSDLFANPADDLDVNVFDASVRGKTSRFAMRFRKPG